MVTKKKALQVSGISAIIIGAVHGIAHMVFKTQPIEQQIIYVGISVVVSVFGVAYYGMRSKR